MMVAADAKGIDRAFQKMEGRIFIEVNVKLLADGEALEPSTDNIEDYLPFLHKVGQHDMVVLFMAGNGIRVQRGNCFFLPSDADKTTPGTFRSSKLIKWIDIKDALDSPATVVAFLDTCHAGALFEPGRFRSPDSDLLIWDLTEQGSVVFAASRGKGKSLRAKEWGTYVSGKVPEMTGGQSHPVSFALDGYKDFPLWVVH